MSSNMIEGEYRWVDFALPGFLDNFRQQCISYTLPVVDYFISSVESIDSSLTVVLIVLIAVELIRIMIIEAKSVSSVKVGQAGSSGKLMKDLKDMKKELKSIQGMIAKLQHNQGPQKQSRAQQVKSAPYSQEAISRVVESCKKSWQQRESIASEITDWQIQILQQVKELKSKNRSSRSPQKTASVIQPRARPVSVQKVPKSQVKTAKQGPVDTQLFADNQVEPTRCQTIPVAHPISSVPEQVTKVTRAEEESNGPDNNTRTAESMPATEEIPTEQTPASANLVEASIQTAIEVITAHQPERFTEHSQPETQPIELQMPKPAAKVPPRPAAVRGRRAPPPPPKK